ncbi:hypothetical protein KOI35_38420 [Actinoplanes bogorensis]|uniref:Immunity protein Imm1 n=1 Tax=Paractinoplanes bogorensis TaxID=1610840 RepID=A0ABS5Z135_9ACTN|nr:Imm1 family immunity protein [Actinoplanes bogorensis]MBU2669404.1 hypothetical protein [Actinoplanes bogorensis]
MSAWHFAHENSELTGGNAITRLRERTATGELETWLRHDDGRVLAVVTNGNRAMVMIMDEPDDPGRHAVDLGAKGEESGYRLSNGQVDRYHNSDTVPLDAALDAVRELIDHDRWPAALAWQDDRG